MGFGHFGTCLITFQIDQSSEALIHEKAQCKMQTCTSVPDIQFETSLALGHLCADSRHLCLKCCFRESFQPLCFSLCVEAYLKMYHEVYLEGTAASIL